MSKITCEKIEFETFDNRSFAAPIKEADIPERLFIPIPESGELTFAYKRGEKIMPNTPVLKAEKPSDSLPVFLPCEATAIGIGFSEHPLYGRKKYAIVKTEKAISSPHTSHPIQTYSLNDLIKISFAAGIRISHNQALFSELMQKDYDAVICNCADNGPYCFSAGKLLFSYPKELTCAIGIIASALNVKGKEIIFNLKKKFYSKIPLFLNGVRITNLDDENSPSSFDKQIKAFGYNKSLILTPSSLISLYNSIVYGIHETHGVISIYDVKLKKGGCYKIPYGSMISDILPMLGYNFKRRTAYIGNPLMNIKVNNFKFPYLGGINAIILTNNSPKNLECCVACGRCDEICPVNIYPSLIAASPLKTAAGKAKLYNITDCTGCRLCSYVCPADFNISEVIIKAKEEASNDKTNEDKTS